MTDLGTVTIARLIMSHYVYTNAHVHNVYCYCCKCMAFEQVRLTVVEKIAEWRNGDKMTKFYINFTLDIVNFAFSKLLSVATCTGLCRG